MRHFFVVCLQKYSYCVCGNIPDGQRELAMCVNVFSFVFELVLTEKSMRNAANLTILQFFSRNSALFDCCLSL